MSKHVLFGQLKANPGQRDELAQTMLANVETLRNMEGCIYYILNESIDDPDLLWIMEMWENADAHAASLKNENVRALIERCRPLIAGGSAIPVRPIGGKGL
ncbi:putative quinol monooxygenase [Paenibacillus guangzhouensis]|uniref:putative quinol monooxygenase n=1 Tax=Paenibacillus guangzhouensis TaxID=1473112 RepID=UPI00126781E8|nr:putative quinol monooxygenase [Paenibacillus guangzhouensis]